MTPEEFRSDILEPCRQVGAATLVAPTFGRAVATLDTSYDESNRNQVLKLAFPTACEEIKVTSCPGWNHRPAQIFDNIKQVITDEHGNVTQSTVQNYGNHTLYCCRALGNDPWELCVASHFYNNLAQEIKDHISLSYNPGTIERTPRVQTRAIQRLLSLATKAERAIEATRMLVSTSTEVALHANNVALYGQVAADKVMSNTSDGAASTASSITAATGRIPTFASQAERTIAANPSGTTLDGDFVWEPGNCFGW